MSLMLIVIRYAAMLIACCCFLREIFFRFAFFRAAADISSITIIAAITPLFRCRLLY